MDNKGFFASICSFFGGLFSSDSDQSSNTSSNDGLTSVERYIRNQSANTSSSVEAYIQKNSKPVTTVEAYIRNQANAKPVTSVEQYIRDNS
ncbi:MAG: hypothetical protein COA83_08155 [Methylophaga sp.]|nr:MAG: hypothetical protein COA83_08155 [Methylophaga sp.]